MTSYTKIAAELEIKVEQVQAVDRLLAEGATIPFIARYRKEATGSLDETVITSIRNRLHQLAELDKRRQAILKSLTERELLTDDLQEQLQAADTLAVLEDIYLPYRPKRRTRAAVAREKGLEPLAEKLLAQVETTDPLQEAAAFVDHEKDVATAEEALKGARDIIAEWVNEDQDARARMRSLYRRKGVFQTKVIKGKEAEGSKYRDYFDWQEPAAAAPSHRILAMRRGEKEGILTLRLRPPEEEALALLEKLFVKSDCPASREVKTAVHDSYKRLLGPSMETESRLATKERADEEAIKVFADNLRELLLAPPLGQKNVLAIDPGLRTGCKLACLDRQGKLLHTDTIYPFTSEKGSKQAAAALRHLVEHYNIEAIAVGNGTGGRDTEALVRSLELPAAVQVVLVNESGASVYSASEAARKEFPDLDVTFRGAVSIGRRLMDPLAELVKIDPKAIGVGQYQHDVDQQALKRALDDVVMSCVNGVGVEVNTASEELLTYVSGLGPQLARNIVNYRNENGPFESRHNLKKVPRLGPKAFEQAAGFLRIRNGRNPLDASAVHPESYPVVQAMARDLGCTVKELMEQPELRERIQLDRYVTDDVGLPTLTDIVAELARPGRDPRQEFEQFSFADKVQTMEDLRPGMKLPGIVTNVTAFGAFVDIGVHQDGLVHISKLANHFVKDPHTVVKVQQKVTVTVLDVDLNRRRISLSMRDDLDQQKSGSPKGSVSGKKHSRKRPAAPRKPAPFHNPFAEAFKKQRK
ncbi:MAG: RNA-binding transcriptional accessory protein [Deltaproteobacteria bacterium]|nr:RNA-binding transcriptional accessory protein [Deltaproteobacteria bacterium]MBW2071336.1 RNA-binding transcriptional accessory protein [Deltaproteobacteria bacterium]